MVINKPMSFGKAIDELKEGQKMTRLSWDNRNKFLIYVDKTVTPDLKLYPIHDAYIALRQDNNHIAPWTPTQEDILADDWCIVAAVTQNVRKKISEINDILQNCKDNNIPTKEDNNVLKNTDKCDCNNKDNSKCEGSQECQKKCLNECHKLKTPDDKKKIQAIHPKIVVEIFKGRPYYSIVWYDGQDNEFHVGYSSYKLEYCIKWLKENFEAIEVSETIEKSICDLLHKQYLNHFIDALF